MIKAVIFDMFETLVSLFQGKTYFGENIAADLGVDPQLFRREWHATEHARTVGEYTIEEGLKLTLEKLGIYTEDAVRMAAEKRKAALNDTFSVIPPESLALLKELKRRGLKIGLITNTFSDERDFIRASELFPFFDEAFISYEKGLSKPDPAIYLGMTEALGLKPEECLYVGDGGSKELYAARDVGMKAVQATWFYAMAFEPHIPCHPLPEFEQAAKPLDILNFLDPARVPELTTLCYLEKEGQYLMLHRVKKEKDINRDKYIGVGGHFEYGESPDECLKREVLEETGLTLLSYRARGIVTFRYGEDVTEYMHLYTADVWEGELIECDEGELVWIDIDKVPSLPLWEGDRIFFKLLAEEEPFFSLKLVYEADGRLREAVLNGKTMSGPSF